jgi:hypothetical protein
MLARASSVFAGSGLRTRSTFVYRSISLLLCHSFLFSHHPGLLRCCNWSTHQTLLCICTSQSSLPDHFIFFLCYVTTTHRPFSVRCATVISEIVLAFRDRSSFNHRCLLRRFSSLESFRSPRLAGRLFRRISPSWMVRRFGYSMSSWSRRLLGQSLEMGLLGLVGLLRVT